jgi:hypothetical protein
MARIESGLYAGLSRQELVGLDSVSGLHSYFHPLLRNGASAHALVAQPVIADADMEAVGTASWTPGNGAALSKVGSAYEGAQCLQIAGDGVTPSPYVRQLGIATTGTRLNWEWMVSGDGVGAVPQMLYEGANAFGTAAVAWQLLQREDTATTTHGPLLIGAGTGATSAIRCDAATVACSSVTQWLDRANPAHGLVQAVPSTVPYREFATGLLRYDAGDTSTDTRAAADWGHLHRANHTAIIGVIPRAATVNDQWLYSTLPAAAAATDVGIQVGRNSNGAVRIRVGDGSGAWLVDSTSAAGVLAVNTAALIAIRWDATNLEVWVNGTKILDVAPASTGSAAAPAAALTVPAITDADAFGIIYTVSRAVSLGDLMRICRRHAVDMMAYTGVAWIWTS